MPPRSNPSRSGALPSITVRTLPAVHPNTARPLTSAELQLASDIALATGNTRRGEMLSWQAHAVRTGVPA